MIPYCGRHHPLHLHLKDNGCRGTACSPLSGQEGRRPQTARVITRCNLKSNGYPAHHPPLPGTINPVCATREHVRPPALQAPLVTCAMREHGGLAGPPRSFRRSSAEDHEHPLVAPQVSHFRHVPLRTSVNCLHSVQGSPSYPFCRATWTAVAVSVTVSRVNSSL
jgi:hypothetical protein